MNTRFKVFCILQHSPISVRFYPCSYICNCLKMPKISQINKYSDILFSLCLSTEMTTMVEFRTVVLNVVLHCEGCARTVKRAIKRIPGAPISPSLHDLSVSLCLWAETLQKSGPQPVAHPSGEHFQATPLPITTHRCESLPPSVVTP